MPHHKHKQLGSIRMFVIFSVYCLWLMIPNSAKAAIIEIAPASSDASIGSQQILSVSLDTQSQVVNTIDATIAINPIDMSSVKLITGSSIISYWIDRPTIINGTIHFSGIVIHGYKGSAGQLFRIALTPTASGDINADFDTKTKPQAYLNDGLGTPTHIATQGAVIHVAVGQPQTSPTPSPEGLDTTPPEPFQPIIVSESELFDGQWTLLFNTTDSSSGINHYEVYESTSPPIRAKDFSWIKAESPYLLTDQGLNSYVYVKAIDGAGNIRLEMIPPHSVGSYDYFWLILILILLLLILLLIYIIKKLNDKRKEDEFRLHQTQAEASRRVQSVATNMPTT